MVGANEYVNQIGGFIFADLELTSFDALPEVWGRRAAWTSSLAAVRDRIAVQTGARFQVARCAYYENGLAGVDFHVDLPAYGTTAVIASLSLGAERQFVLRSTVDPTDQVSLSLASGSLLFMGEGCQERYEHALLRDGCREPRVNLTFRKYGWE